MQLQKFTQEGSIYTLKKYLTFKIIILVGTSVMVAIGWKADMPFLTWLFGILTVLNLITMLTDKLTIDTQSKVIKARMGIYMQYFEIPFDKIINFEVFTMTINFIRSGVYLNVYHENTKGKEKVKKLAQSMSKKYIQEVLNEIDEILEHDKR